MRWLLSLILLSLFCSTSTANDFEVSKSIAENLKLNLVVGCGCEPPKGKWITTKVDCPWNDIKTPCILIGKIKNGKFEYTQIPTNSPFNNTDRLSKAVDDLKSASQNLKKSISDASDIPPLSTRVHGKVYDGWVWDAKLGLWWLESEYHIKLQLERQGWRWDRVARKWVAPIQSYPQSQNIPSFRSRSC